MVRGTECLIISHFLSQKGVLRQRVTNGTDRLIHWAKFEIGICFLFSVNRKIEFFQATASPPVVSFACYVVSYGLVVSPKGLTKATLDCECFPTAICEDCG